jgi:hypothetical protein
MKKTHLARLIALTAMSLVMGHAAYSQPAVSGVAPPKAAASESEDSPPLYVLVLAGVCAVVFIGARRSGKF